MKHSQLFVLLKISLCTLQGTPIARKQKVKYNSIIRAQLASHSCSHHVPQLPARQTAKRQDTKEVISRFTIKPKIHANTHDEDDEQTIAGDEIQTGSAARGKMFWSMTT